MKESEVKIEYDSTPLDFYDTVTSILNTLGVEYTESGEEIITIKYKHK
tara:strand:- start:7325 stop:7468 length:144 start_codon:yes stop_codon:yes gene_type:complete